MPSPLLCPRGLAPVVPSPPPTRRRQVDPPLRYSAPRSCLLLFKSSAVAAASPLPAPSCFLRNSSTTAPRPFSSPTLPPWLTCTGSVAACQSLRHPKEAAASCRFLCPLALPSCPDPLAAPHLRLQLKPTSVAPDSGADLLELRRGGRGAPRSRAQRHGVGLLELRGARPRLVAGAPSAARTPETGAPPAA
ncbi:unnamed protein product [Urochloa humidicola]